MRRKIYTPIRFVDESVDDASVDNVERWELQGMGRGTTMNVGRRAFGEGEFEMSGGNNE
jgi:hypothetical protein